MVAISAAKPALLSAPLIAAAPAPIVTATSSQYFHRNHNALAAAYVAAPAAYVAPAAPYVAAPAPYVAAAAPYVAAPAPYVAAASPYVAAPAPFVAYW